MQRLAVEDGVAASHVHAVLHNVLHVLLVPNVHETARRQAVLAQDLKEDVNGRPAEGARHFADAAPGPRRDAGVARRANLPHSVSVQVQA